MRPERQRRQERDRREALRPAGVANDEEKEQEIGECQRRVGARLRRVEEQQRRNGRENEEEGALTPAREPADGRPDKEKAEEREKPRQRVGEPGALRRGDERLFENVEEGRTRVAREGGDERGGGEPRGPDREDLVVPERPRLQQPESGGGGQDRDRQRRGGGDALSVAPVSFDDLS